MKKILSVITLLVLLVSSVFATNWVKVFTSEGEGEDEAYNLYFDFDAREPFYIKCESIEYFLNLKDLYEEVEVCLENIEDEDWKPFRDFAFENNCYAMRMEYEDYCVDIHINIDDTVIMYIYSGFKNPENEEE